MNDRHRTIARWKKQHTPHEFNPYNMRDVKKALQHFVDSIPVLIDYIKKTINEFMRVTSETITRIKEMPEDELQTFISEHPELKAETIAAIYKLRGHNNNGATDNGTENMQ